MAMRSEVMRTPDWLRVEVTHDPRNFDYRLDIAVRCDDGWAHLVSLEVDPQFGSEMRSKKLGVYQRHHEFATRRLASETLERT